MFLFVKWKLKTNCILFFEISPVSLILARAMGGIQGEQDE